MTLYLLDKVNVTTELWHAVLGTFRTLVLEISAIVALVYEGNRKISPNLNRYVTMTLLSLRSKK